MSWAIPRPIMHVYMKGDFKAKYNLGGCVNGIKKNNKRLKYSDGSVRFKTSTQISYAELHIVWKM